MKEKFKWDKFIADCILCFSILTISPFVLFYPIQWIFGLYPIQWIFDIDWIEPSVTFWFVLESTISLSIINFFYRIPKLNLFLSLIFVICYSILACYFFSHGR